LQVVLEDPPRGHCRTAASCSSGGLFCRTGSPSCIGSSTYRVPYMPSPLRLQGSGNSHSCRVVNVRGVDPVGPGQRCPAAQIVPSTRSRHQGRYCVAHPCAKNAQGWGTRHPAGHPTAHLREYHTLTPPVPDLPHHPAQESAADSTPESGPHRAAKRVGSPYGSDTRSV
jgi:hypothetical protein